MSNTVTTNPITLTTTLASYINAANCGTVNTPFYIDKVEWLSPATVADTFTLTDNAGNTIATGVCEVNLQSQVFPIIPRRYVKDFRLTQISSGTIVVWISY